MQKASAEYKAAMKLPFRNRGYIKATIGMVNSDAEESVQMPFSKNSLTYFSDNRKLFEGYEVTKVYATAEENFSKVDGSMYFLPSENYGETLYNNGAVSEGILGALYINFKDSPGYDIKGLTIDFSEHYPTSFRIEWDNGATEYSNAQHLFVTEDVFDGVTFFKITPLAMVNGNNRFRIYQFICGLAKTFSNVEVKNYSFKDYVSPITDTLPSQDMTLEVDNQKLYYSVDNSDSALAFLEPGQEVSVAFGYDVTGNGDIEWMPANTCYLKSWFADDVTAKFTAIDRFDFLSEKYYKGKYSKDGVSLYDLAIDVLHDAGITDSREYFVDPYLQNVIVHNPIPVVKHTEALQIIANAGRCALRQDRKKRIRLQASFVPDMIPSVNNKADYSDIAELLKNTEKVGYAIASNDFSLVDGSLLFISSADAYLPNTGYISEVIADENGIFETNPVITITLEAGFTAYGLGVKFRNVTPQEFVIRTYYQDALQQEKQVVNPALEYMDGDEFAQFDRMEIEFTKGHPNARITVDSILVSDITDYVLTRMHDLVGNPVGTRQEHIKSVSVIRNVYRENAESKSLKSEELVLNTGDTEYELIFSKPVYDLAVSAENENVVVTIEEQSNYRVLLKFSGITEDNITVKYDLVGREYIVDEIAYKVPHYQYGAEKTWNNPLISSSEHAKDVEEWLSVHFLGDVSYQVNWRGDPRTDANDLFYLELAERENSLIRVYEKQIKFNGAWSETIKARKAVASWQ